MEVEELVKHFTNCSCLTSLYVTWFKIFFVSLHLLLLLVLLMITLKTLDYLLFNRYRSGEGRFAFVSGCDSGFGHGAAYQLNSRGVHVFAACFTQDAVQRYIFVEFFTSRRNLGGG